MRKVCLSTIIIRYFTVVYSTLSQMLQVYVITNMTHNNDTVHMTVYKSLL